MFEIGLRACVVDAIFDPSIGGFKDANGPCNPCDPGKTWSNTANDCIVDSGCPQFYQERKPDGTCGLSTTILLIAGGAAVLLLMLTSKR